MTPLRLLVYGRFLCGNPTLTPAQIKTAMLDVRTSALINPNSPAREHDVAYYCQQVADRIDQLTGAVPAYTAAEVKHQLLGELNNLIPPVP